MPITVKEWIVFDGHEGWESGSAAYKLACGASIAQAPNRDLLCCWLSGSDGEPAADNCILMARSTDDGLNIELRPRLWRFIALKMLSWNR